MSVPVENPIVERPLPPVGDLAALEAHLTAGASNLLAILDQWRAPELGARWREDPAISCMFAKALIRAGHVVLGYEVACEGLGLHPGNQMLQYYCALALARARNPAKAWKYAEPLSTTETLDPAVAADMLSLAGRIRKDMSEIARDPRARKFQARLSAAAYERALHASARSYPAINAASMWQVAGDRSRAKQFAQTAARLAVDELDASKDDYWIHATIGEARLLMGQGDPIEAYAAAVRLAGRRYGDVASMRRNVMMLATSVDVPPALLDLLAVKTVVFSGHMVDHPNRSKQRLPPRFPADSELERRVAGELAELIAANEYRIGYSSVACGSDILFCEAMLARGAELHVVLPFDLDDFFTTSVDFGQPEHPQWASWRARCRAILARADEIHYATREPYGGADSLFTFCDQYMRGLALQRAAMFATDPAAIVVLDETTTIRTGANAFARRWRATGHTLRTIDLGTLRTASSKPATMPARAPKSRRATDVREHRQVHAMLFADVKNFSRLADVDTAPFFETFHTTVAEVLRAKKRAVFQNTWGDGLFVVCADVVRCAELAINLLERFDKVAWAKLGLPADTAIRMGLHVGPIYRVHDPVIRRTNFAGAHVNRAARIEPVTAPGSAYASEQFAAVLSDTPGHGLVCDYVGVHYLAKEYDRCALYRLRR